MPLSIVSPILKEAGTPKGHPESHVCGFYHFTAKQELFHTLSPKSFPENSAQKGKYHFFTINSGSQTITAPNIRIVSFVLKLRTSEGYGYGGPLQIAKH